MYIHKIEGTYLHACVDTHAHTNKQIHMHIYTQTVEMNSRSLGKELIHYSLCPIMKFILVKNVPKLVSLLPFNVILNIFSNPNL